MKAPTDVEQLESELSEPVQGTAQALGALTGDLLIVGAGGKMGPSLARMARRAFDQAGQRERRVIAVSRFTQRGLQEQLRAWGVQTVAADLFREEEIAALPDAPNVVCMLGFKFGTEQAAGRTWATNTYLPALLSRRFAGSKMVAFSTGNVYPLVRWESTGSKEEDRLEPVGEYGMSALGRERIFQFFSEQQQTPMTLIRLNYACELRYGVLVDIARRVLAEEPVPLGMGYFNVVWQGDANNIALQCFGMAAAPPAVVNLAGPERLSVREVAQEFGRRLGKQVHFEGVEGPLALLSDGQRALKRAGGLRVPASTLIEWIADWLRRGGVTWDKPTHFEVQDGRF